MAKVHNLAVVDNGAELADDVVVEAYCRIGQNVKIGPGTLVRQGAIIDGHTTIGCNNRIHSYAVIGTEPQDLKYKGEPTMVEIGDNNVIREFATINRSAFLGENTTLGNNCLIMTYAHIAHNCHIGNGVILANSVQLAGHITIDDFATVGGDSAVHQFVKIGRYAFIGGASGIKKDVPPFIRGEGMPFHLVGLNSVGLQRRGFSSQTVANIKRMYKFFFLSHRNISQSLDCIDNYGEMGPEEREFYEFIKNSGRGVARSV